MLNDRVVRLIRTVVPTAIGALITWLPFLDGVLNVEVLVVLAINGYYALAAYLEGLNPVFGWLLGVPKNKTVTY